MNDPLNIYTELVEVGNKKYRLQHPGNRAWIRLKQNLIDLETKKPDMEKLFDYAFEHCVFPEGHNFQPTLDNINGSDLEEWEALLPSFFRYKTPDKFKYRISDSTSEKPNKK